MFRLMERDQYWSDPDWCSWLKFVVACLNEELPTGFTVALLHLWFCWFGLVRNEILQSLNPKDRERVPQLLQNCVKLKSVSCTSILLARTCDFRKCTEFLLMLTSNLQCLLQNQSLETIVICNVALCFPHGNIVGDQLCDECFRSNVRSVCRMLLSISLLHEQVCSQTTEYQVPNTCQI